LKVKAIPANLPDEIVVDVTPLRIGNKLYVGGIKTEGYSFMHPDNAVVVAVKMSRNAMKGGAAAMDDEDEEEVATEEGAAPEATEAAAE
jgi:large subunit ribosomal protein L25